MGAYPLAPPAQQRIISQEIQRDILKIEEPLQFANDLIARNACMCQGCAQRSRADFSRILMAHVPYCSCSMSKYAFHAASISYWHSTYNIYLRILATAGTHSEERWLRPRESLKKRGFECPRIQVDQNGTNGQDLFAGRLHVAPGGRCAFGSLESIGTHTLVFSVILLSAATPKDNDAPLRDFPHKGAS